MMNDGRWAVIAGSGYNDNGPDPDAHLFILFLEEGLDGEWTVDSDYLRIEAPEDPALATVANRNGLSSPVVADLDGNGTADRVYAGDLFGNLWAFDLCDADAVSGICSANPADWLAANASLSPLFTAELGGVRQPITHKPVISKHPTVGDLDANQPNVMVYFGTGQYLTDTDPTTTEPQSFYGVWDRGVASRTRTHLRSQTFDTNFANQEVVTDNPVDWNTQYGWYIDLPDARERVVVEPLLRANILFFNSFVPSDLPCAGGGTSFLYGVDMENGGTPDFPPFDTDNDGVVDTNDLASSGSGDQKPVSRKVHLEEGGGIAAKTNVLGDIAFTALSTAKISVTALFEIDRLDKGRLSWQELNPF
jgi:type IV pilus assembly protein PilY1